MSTPRRFGAELDTIKQPQKVKVLILSESRASPKDFYLISSFTKLIKIDLSYNKLTAFPAGFSFKPFTQLRTLFLHYNKFTAIKQLLPVTQSSSLHYLTLFGNPLQQAKARHFFVNEIQSLVLMDDKPVRLDERNPDFSPKEPTIQLLTFPLAELSIAETQSKVYVQILIKELTVARKAYLNANPVILIQRWWRHNLRMRQTKWKNGTPKPPEQTIVKHSSLSLYKQNLQQMAKQQKKQEVFNSPNQHICRLLKANTDFWHGLQEIIQKGRVLLTREYCMLRGIHFQQLKGMAIVRHQENINNNIKLRKKRRLPFLLEWHKQLIIKKQLKPSGKKEIAREISSKSSQDYKINRNKFIHIQQKLIKLQEKYHNYVVPQLTLQQFNIIIKKQYWRAMRAILKGNHYELPFILEYLTIRSQSAISVQRYWRGYKVRKSVNAYRTIKEKDSAVKIQRWIRRLPFIHRRKFLLEVAPYLKAQRNNNQITLEVGQLEAIQIYATYKEYYSRNFAIPFQLSQFQVKTREIIYNSQRRPDPAYLGLSFLTKPQQKVKKSRKSTIMQILFKGVREVSRVSDSRGTKFVVLTYDSMEQTLNRKFILALKTYRMLNHQFIRSREAPNVSPHNSLDIIAQINNNRMVSMVYDSHKDLSSDSATRKLEISRSQGSDIISMGNNIFSVRLKYFLVKEDLSCTLFLRESNYRKQQRHPMQLQMRQFYLPRRSSHRYADEDPTHEVASKISRNIISLDQLQSFHSQRGEKLGLYNKILNTDQSHTLLQPQDEHHRSLNRLQSYRKSDSYDRFNKQVYPTEVQYSLRWQKEDRAIEEKRERIEQIKASHKKNIESITLQKTQNLTNLRRSIRRQSEDRMKMIDDARNMLEQERVRQHDRVKEHFKNISSNFEQEFLKKGIGSIRRGFKQFQKQKPQKSIQVSPPHNKNNHPLKTQVKELSLSFEPEIPTRQALKQNAQIYNSIQKSLKSHPSSQAILKEESVAKHQEPSHKNRQQWSQQKKELDLQRKKLRKKRLVHSVFPEQFYPLKKSNQIGFQLPKISKK